MNGVNVGFFETNETHPQFMDYNTSTSGPNSDGFKAFGIDDQTNTRTAYFFVHHDSGNDTYALGAWFYSEADGSYDMDVIYNGFGDYVKSPSNPEAQDDPESTGSGAADETYVTNGNGDPVAKHRWGYGTGDGHMYEFTPGSISITVEFQDLSDGRPHVHSDPMADLRGRGPKNNTSKSYGGYGSTFDIDINL